MPGAALITQRSRVQVPPPLPATEQVRGPFQAEGPLRFLEEVAEVHRPRVYLEALAPGRFVSGMYATALSLWSLTRSENEEIARPASQRRMYPVEA